MLLLQRILREKGVIEPSGIFFVVFNVELMRKLVVIGSTNCGLLSDVGSNASIGCFSGGFYLKKIGKFGSLAQQSDHSLIANVFIQRTGIC